MCIILFLAATSGTQAQARSQAGPSAPPHLRVNQFDVGQGDAALITTPEGRWILIDAGPDANNVADLLQRGCRPIDLVIASHNHADHIGGMPAVFAAFAVRAYVRQRVAAYNGDLSPHARGSGERTWASIPPGHGTLDHNRIR